MNQASSAGSMKGLIFALLFNISMGILLLLAPNEWDYRMISTEELLLVLVVEILALEVQSIFIPAYAVWSERKLIVEGTSKVLAKGKKLRSEATRSIYGVWCYSGWDYAELSEYFREEKELMKKKQVKTYRLVNIYFAGEENVRKHCEEFKEEIISGIYVLVSVSYHSREFLVVDRKKALILYQDLCAKDVGGGIGPYDEPNWVASYADEYEELVKKGTQLRMDGSNWQQQIEDWIKSALKGPRGKAPTR